MARRAIPLCPHVLFPHPPICCCPADAGVLGASSSLDALSALSGLTQLFVYSPQVRGRTVGLLAVGRAVGIYGP